MALVKIIFQMIFFKPFKGTVMHIEKALKMIAYVFRK